MSFIQRKADSLLNAYASSLDQNPGFTVAKLQQLPAQDINLVDSLARNINKPSSGEDHTLFLTAVLIGGAVGMAIISELFNRVRRT